MKRSISQLDALRSIRKPTLPATRIERPSKGVGSYRRRLKWGKAQNVQEN